MQLIVTYPSKVRVGAAVDKIIKMRDVRENLRVFKKWKLDLISTRHDAGFQKKMTSFNASISRSIGDSSGGDHRCEELSGGQNNNFQCFESLEDAGEYRTLLFCPHSILCINLAEPRALHRTDVKTCENLKCNFGGLGVAMGDRHRAVEHRFIGEIGEQVSKCRIESLTAVDAELLALVVDPNVCGHSFSELESAVLLVMKAKVERQGIAGCHMMQNAFCRS
jgi:hypothetical protein